MTKYKPRPFGGTLKLPSTNSYIPPADSVSVSDGTSVVGKPSNAEAISLADVNTLSGVAALASENVSLLEATTSLKGSIQNTDSTPISDQTNPIGVITIASESVLPGENTPALAGQPSPTDSVPITEQSTLQGVTSITSENVGLGELALLTGKPSVTDAPVQPSENMTAVLGALSSTDGVPISDQINLLGTTSIASENILPSDSSSQVGQSFITNNAQLSDQTNLLGSTQISPENALPSENNSQAGQSFNSDIVQPSENNSQTGIAQSSESGSLSETKQLTNQSQIIEITPLSEQNIFTGFSQITPETVQPVDLISLLGLTQSSTDGVSLGETVSYFSAIVFIAPPESVSLSDQVSMLGSAQQIEGAQLSDQSTLQGGHPAV